MLATARRLVPALALAAALSLALGACSRHAEAPAPVVDAAPGNPAQPGPGDAAAPHPSAARSADAAPDTEGPPRARGHRAGPPPRAAGDGSFKIEGSIGRADAETVLHGARARLDACYEKARGKDPALAGRVSFRLSIDNRGNVPMAEVVASTLGGGDVEKCMAEALRELQFPPSSTGGESTLSFPMTFGR
jgi:hypothetical protein